MDDLIVIWSIERAREAARIHSEVLWFLTDEGIIEQTTERCWIALLAPIAALLKSVGLFEGGPAVPIRADRDAPAPALRG